jgi:subtilase family serine protease
MDEKTVKVLVDSKNLVKEMNNGNNVIEKNIKCEEK